MPVESLSRGARIVHREGRFFRVVYQTVCRRDRPDQTVAHADRAMLAAARRGAPSIDHSGVGKRAAESLERLDPSNGELVLGPDGYVYFSGDPFPPGGHGIYRIGEVTPTDGVRLYPGVVLDTTQAGARRFRIGYRYLDQYRRAGV